MVELILDKDEEVVKKYSCRCEELSVHNEQSWNTQEVQPRVLGIRVGEPKKKKVLVETPVSEKKKVGGDLIITNKRILFIRRQGFWIGKREELSLEVPLNDIQSVHVEGIVFKTLVIGSTNYGNSKFSSLPADEAKETIMEIASKLKK